MNISNRIVQSEFFWLSLFSPGCHSRCCETEWEHSWSQSAHQHSTLLKAESFYKSGGSIVINSDFNLCPMSVVNIGIAKLTCFFAVIYLCSLTSLVSFKLCGVSCLLPHWQEVSERSEQGLGVCRVHLQPCSADLHACLWVGGNVSVDLKNKARMQFLLNNSQANNK